MVIASMTVIPVLPRIVRITRAALRSHQDGVLELPRKGSRSGFSDILLTVWSCSIASSTGRVDATANGSRAAEI
jgi:hypothetical protein